MLFNMEGGSVYIYHDGGIKLYPEKLFLFGTEAIIKHCRSWFKNSSSVLPTSQDVYQPINHRNLWSIAVI